MILYIVIDHDHAVFVWSGICQLEPLGEFQFTQAPFCWQSLCILRNGYTAGLYSFKRIISAENVIFCLSVSRYAEGSKWSVIIIAVVQQIFVIVGFYCLITFHIWDIKSAVFTWHADRYRIVLQKQHIFIRHFTLHTLRCRQHFQRKARKEHNRRKHQTESPL